MMMTRLHRVRTMSAMFAMAAHVVGLAGLPAAFAQTTSSQAPMDVVVLKNGGMVRGTIAELVPGQPVEIQLADGTKRRFSRDEVTYAGPSAGMPMPASGPAPLARKDEDARLRFVSRQEGIHFFRETGTTEGFIHGSHVEAFGRSSNYVDLCGAPCEVALPAGRYIFAMRKENGKVIDADPVDVPVGISTFEGKYVSRTGLRAALLIGGVAGMLTGAGILYYAVAGGGVNHECDPVVPQDCHDAVDVPLTVVGSGLLLVGAIVGLIPAYWILDEAHMQIVSLKPSASLSGWRSENFAHPTGMGIQWAW